jgi:hypothetical protein
VTSRGPLYYHSQWKEGEGVKVRGRRRRRRRNKVGDSRRGGVLQHNKKMWANKFAYAIRVLECYSL